MTTSVPNLNTEELRMYAKMLRLSNLRANCSDIIHRAQIDKPTYLELITTILKDEVLAAALLDRLLYRCDVVKLTGTSYRMENRSGFSTMEKEERL